MFKFARLKSEVVMNLMELATTLAVISNDFTECQ
jgi:hypothetical protein